MSEVRLVNHVGLTVTDLEASADFYRDVVGFDELRRPKNHASGDWIDTLMKTKGVELRAIQFGAEGFALQLVQYVSAAGEPARVAHSKAGTVHFAINVDDLDAKREQVLATGNYAPTPIVDQPLAGVRSFYAFDPDGIPVEFVTGPYVAETVSYTD